MLVVILLNTFLLATAVSIHYEVLRLLSVWIPRLSIKNRFRVLFGIFGALIAHTLEVWLFAFGYYFMLGLEKFGYLAGNFNNTLLDCVYFSYTSYTSLGIGDIYPVGEIRFLAGLEALTGLVLITWTASFMFLEMSKFWRD